MNSALTLVLVFALLTLASICKPQADDRTASQLYAAVRRSTWRQRAWWLLQVLVDPPFVVAWYAARTALYLASVIVAWIAVRLASWLAMDGRHLRVYRTTSARAVLQ
jgi:hypothetical protein